MSVDLDLQSPCFRIGLYSSLKFKNHEKLKQCLKRCIDQIICVTFGSNRMFSSVVCSFVSIKPYSNTLSFCNSLDDQLPLNRSLHDIFNYKQHFTLTCLYFLALDILRINTNFLHLEYHFILQSQRQGFH